MQCAALKLIACSMQIAGLNLNLLNSTQDSLRTQTLLQCVIVCLCVCMFAWLVKHLVCLAQYFFFGLFLAAAGGHKLVWALY